MKRKMFKSISTNDKEKQLKKIIKYKLNYALDDNSLNDIINNIDIDKQYKIITCTTCNKFYKYAYNINDISHTRNIISLHDNFIPGEKQNGKIIKDFYYNEDSSDNILLLINDENKNIENNYIVVYVNNLFETNTNGLIIDDNIFTITDYKGYKKFKINNILYEYIYIRDRNIILSIKNINNKNYIKFTHKPDTIISNINNSIYVINNL